MSPRKILIPLAAIAAALAVAAPASAAPCVAKGAKAKVTTRDGVVSMRTVGNKVRVYACLFSVGKPVFVHQGEKPDPVDGYTEFARTFRFGGQFFAFFDAYEYEDDRGGDGGAKVREFNLKSGRQTRVTQVYFGLSSDELADLVVSPTGALAWIEDARELHVWDAAGKRLLDAPVRPHSLKGDGSKISWIARGKRRSTTLR
jgi:hypothetical protein